MLMMSGAPHAVESSLAPIRGSSSVAATIATPLMVVVVVVRHRGRVLMMTVRVVIASPHRISVVVLRRLHEVSRRRPRKICEAAANVPD